MSRLMTLFFDGGARSNPGPAGAGFVLIRDNRFVLAGMGYLGVQSNNAAEYTGLIQGLRAMQEHGISGPLLVKGDSELVVKQINGLYKVKSSNLKPLHQDAVNLLHLTQGRIVHIPRAENAMADYLANVAMDTQCDETILEYITNEPARFQTLQQYAQSASDKRARSATPSDVDSYNEGNYDHDDDGDDGEEEGY